MKFFECVKNTVRNNKKAAAAYTLAVIIILVGSILTKKSDGGSHAESAGTGLIILAILVAMSTFFAQKCCPNACERKTREQLILERTNGQKYGTVNGEEEEEETGERFSMWCDSL